MSIPAHIEHLYRTHLDQALDRIQRREPQQPMPGNPPRLVEGSFPTVDAGTAGVDLRISQLRQAIYAHERLIDRMYDLARANRNAELHDVIRAEYLAIHGPQD